MASQGTVERAVRAELRALGSAQVAPGLAAAAINLAQHQDAADSPAAAATAARELRWLMKELRRLTPPIALPDDAVVQISDQRAKRRAEQRAAADQPRRHGRRQPPG